VAVVGLLVNLASAWLLRDTGHGHHRHDHALTPDHAHDHIHRDHNLRSAYFHVLADAATSVLAIAALLAGRYFGLHWLDPVMGIAGAILIGHWAIGLMRDAGAVLTDAVPDPHLAERIRTKLEVGGDRLADLHLWRLGPGHSAVVLTIVSDRPREPDHYKRLLRGVSSLSHVTVEVQRCPDGGHGMAA
jgi:cation diffusion facilitator family transporter